MHIGSDVMIGAGSVVLRDIPDGVLAYGVPARVVRQTSPALPRLRGRDEDSGLHRGGPRHRKNSQASGPTPRRVARSAAPGARLRADLQRLARRGRERRCLPALLSAQRAFGDGPFLLPGARPGHPEAQNAPEPAREAQNGVDSRSGILQTPKELVESPFPLRNQTWKETFCSWTRKPNSYP